MATKKAMVMLHDPVLDIYQMYRYGELVHRVAYLEEYVQRELYYYMDLPVTTYKEILCLKGPIKMWYYGAAVDGKYFTVVQKGWFKGLPLMTIDIQNNEWDPE